MQQGFPLVSIVVPAYNHEDYVVECVGERPCAGLSQYRTYRQNDEARPILPDED